MIKNDSPPTHCSLLSTKNSALSTAYSLLLATYSCAQSALLLAPDYSIQQPSPFDVDDLARNVVTVGKEQECFDDILRPAETLQ